MGLFGFLKKDKKEESSTKKEQNIEFKDEQVDSDDTSNIEKYLNSNELTNKQKQQILYKKFAENSENRNERLFAINEIMDVYMLKDIALNFKDRYSRTLAVAKIEDEQILTEIAEKSPYIETRQIAYERLGKKDKAIAELLKGQNNKDTVKKGLEEIDDEKILTDIVINSKDKKARNGALAKITNKDFLEDIALKSNDESIKEQSIKQISE